MSAPMTKSQMAFELPELSYIDTRWEEPAVRPATHPKRDNIATWFAGTVSAFQAWRERSKARAELERMTDRELFDVGLNRGDLDRILDPRFNQDLLLRGRVL